MSKENEYQGSVLFRLRIGLVDWISYHFWPNAFVRIYYSSMGHRYVEVITPDHPGWLNDRDAQWCRDRLPEKARFDSQYKDLAFAAMKENNLI